MIEPTGERELHECCCVEVSPSGIGVNCSALADADSPFCVDCEMHRSEPHKMGNGWYFTQRLLIKERN